MGAFSLAIKEWAEATNATNERVVRLALLKVLGLIVTRSPVGDPRMWKVNDAFRQAKAEAAETNAANRALNGGKLKRGQKVHASTVISFATKAGPVAFRQKGWAAKSYTGGRFRANWQVGIDTAPTGTIAEPDKSGVNTLAKGREVMESFRVGEVRAVYFVNNLPYGPRLEYEGWSKQAPQGMVRISLMEFDQAIAQAVAETVKP